MGKIMRNGVQYGVDTADVLSTVAECDASASGGKGTTQVASAKALSELNSNVNDLNNRLTASGKSFRFGVTADGEFGYHKEVEGADTVIPFKSGIDLSKAIEMFSCTKPYGTYDLFTAPEDGYYFANSSHMNNDNTTLTCPEGVTTIRYNLNSDSSRACILYYGEIKAGQKITCFFGNNNRTVVQGIFIPK